MDTEIFECLGVNLRNCNDLDVSNDDYERTAAQKSLSDRSDKKRPYLPN